MNYDRFREQKLSDPDFRQLYDQAAERIAAEQTCFKCRMGWWHIWHDNGTWNQKPAALDLTEGAQIQYGIGWHDLEPFGEHPPL